MIRYRIARFLLVLGMLFGFGSGFASLAWHARHGGGCCHGGEAAAWHAGPPGAWGQPPPAALDSADRARFVAEVAQACATAARNAQPAQTPTVVTPAAAPAAAPTVIVVPVNATTAQPLAPPPTAAAPAAAPSGT